MFDEVGVLPEALPAVRAAEGPLLCVCAMVQEERGAGGKPLVADQVGAQAESHPTLLTLVGAFPRCGCAGG